MLSIKKRAKLTKFVKMNYMKNTILLIASLMLMVGCGNVKHVTDPQGGESVNVGYGSVTKDNLTASVSKVKTKRNEVVTYNDIYEYLRGRVPGVQVMPGDPPRIIIRGIGDINGNNDPLFIVDGCEVNDISHINPIDVDSIEVIKDGTASIYGVRGANGVIMITTKH